MGLDKSADILERIRLRLYYTALESDCLFHTPMLELSTVGAIRRYVKNVRISFCLTIVLNQKIGVLWIRSEFVYTKKWKKNCVSYIALTLL